MFNLLHVCALLCVPECMCWAPAYVGAYYYIHNSPLKRNLAPEILISDQMWSTTQSLFIASRYRCAKNAPDHSSFEGQGGSNGHKYICYLNNVSAGQKNTTCVGLKLVKTLVLHWKPLCAQCKIGPSVFICR